MEKELPESQAETGFTYFDSLQAILDWERHSFPGHLAAPSLENFTWNRTKPRTLVCHDHRGGYLDYESLCGSKCPKGEEAANDGHSCPFYAFFHWWYVDVFVYFSHHFVTVPPMPWIAQAHRHGVLILGTFITESDAICQEIFASRENADNLTTKLADLCAAFNFDGWLINIENTIKPEHLDRLERFLGNLRLKLRERVHNCTQVIWYDSVTASGQLKWQNELNQLNKRWFPPVDGFYTNYAWKEEHLQRTLLTLFTECKQKSPLDVYVGIDVFGRGCPGGGGWNCLEPLELIRRYGLSTAIFAPGWICEKFAQLGQQQCLFDNGQRFWHLLKAHLHAHPLKSRQFRTDFRVGFSSECRGTEQYQKQLENNHFCMLKASLQPHYLASGNVEKQLDQPGLAIKGGGLNDIFLCQIPIGQLDRGVEISFEASNPLGVVLTLSNGVEAVQLAHLPDRKFSGHFLEEMSAGTSLQGQQVGDVQVEMKREKLPHVERLQKFRQLLVEATAENATSDWEEQLPNLILDDRYLLLSAVERRQQFEAFHRERQEEKMRPTAMEVEKKTEEEAKEEAEKIEAKTETTEEPNTTAIFACQKAWLPFEEDKFTTGTWHIHKIAIWTAPTPREPAQNITRLFTFEMCIK